MNAGSGVHERALVVNRRAWMWRPAVNVAVRALAVFTISAGVTS
jgi:hypothetical protein